MPRPRLLGRALIWPGHFGATTFGLLGLYPSSLSKSAGFVSLAGKVSLVSISYAKSYFYTILACLFTVRLKFEFRGFVVLERVQLYCMYMAAEMPSRAYIHTL